MPAGGKQLLLAEPRFSRTNSVVGKNGVDMEGKGKAEVGRVAPHSRAGGQALERGGLAGGGRGRCARADGEAALPGDDLLALHLRVAPPRPALHGRPARARPPRATPTITP